jgi:Mrp family chromosome partitioning ATPase
MLAESQQAPVKANVNSRHEEERKLRARKDRIGRKLIVLFGKGGVGKSTVAANLAVPWRRITSRLACSTWTFTGRAFQR